MSKVIFYFRPKFNSPSVPDSVRAGGSLRDLDSTRVFYFGRSTLTTRKNLRGWLYWAARLLGDVQAVEKGPQAIEERIERRLVGKMAGRMLWRLFK